MATNQNTETFTGEQVAAMVRETAEELGSVPNAAQKWGCSAQMVHMVIKGERPPSQGMLDYFKLVKQKPAITYTRKG